MASIIKAVGYTSSAVRFFRNYNSTPVDTYRLEPLSTIMKLAIYTYKPIGTKIGIYDNYIWFQKPDLFQGTKRALYGQDREKICLLREPISSACHWYLKRNNSGEDNKKVKELKIPLISEVMEKDQIPILRKYIEVYQIGARNMQNFNLLKEIGENIESKLQGCSIELRR